MSTTLFTDLIRVSVRRAGRVVLCVSVMSLAVWMVPSAAAQETPEEPRASNPLLPGIRQDTSTTAPATPILPPQDSDGDGVFDDYDSCPASSLDSVVDEFGCAQQSGIGWVGLATGAAVIFVLAIVAVQLVSRRGPDREPVAEGEDDWIVLPAFRSAVKPTPQAPPQGYGGQPGDPPQPYPQSQPGHPPGQSGYPPQQPYPQSQPGYSSQPWTAQPKYDQQQPDSQQPYGPPQGYPPQEPPPSAAAAGQSQEPPAATPSGVPGRPVSTNDPAIGPGDPIPEGETIDAGQVRFHRPPEGTLQILPGRLDVVDGNRGRDGICFVKIPGEEPEVTFGRAVGEQYRHIQLKIPTVSRMHARMRFKDGAWWIENLSSTNPVTVNGHPLGAGEDAQKALDDGDRIEMGEVVFRYWMT